MASSRVDAPIERGRESRKTDGSKVRRDRARLRRIRRLLHRMEWPLAVLALLIVPVLILEDRSTDPTVRWLCSGINWFVWLASPVGRT